tara:strand:- start:68 stop:538 length:471 start_codon:yes stop_codon:yes gene_type:complete
MKNHVVFLTIFFSTIFAQSNINIEAVRKIRLENLKRNYLNKEIRFYIPGKISVTGKLLNVTDKNFIISERNNPSTYSHENVNFIFIDPTFKDLIMVFSISALSGVSSYMAVLIMKKNPDATMKGVISSFGAAIAGVFARSVFYKPIKIDISGETNI